MAHVPALETVRDIIDERVMAFGLATTQRAGSGYWKLAKQIVDRTGINFPQQNLVNWASGKRPSDDMLKRFALGTADAPYRGNPELPPIDRAGMLQRLRRARGSIPVTDAGPELTQAWQNVPAPIRRLVNSILDQVVDELESHYREARDQARHDLELGQVPPDGDDNGGPNGSGGAVQA